VLRKGRGVRNEGKEAVPEIRKKGDVVRIAQHTNTTRR